MVSLHLFVPSGKLCAPCTCRDVGMEGGRESVGWSKPAAVVWACSAHPAALLLLA